MLTELLHILDRGTIHFFSSMSLVMLAFFAFRVAARKSKSAWLPAAWRQQLVIAAVAIFAVSTLREAYDVANGQTVIKAFTDYLSWLAGCGVSAWGLYRFKTSGD